MQDASSLPAFAHVPGWHWPGCACDGVPTVWARVRRRAGLTAGCIILPGFARRRVLPCKQTRRGFFVREETATTEIGSVFSAERDSEASFVEAKAEAVKASKEKTRRLDI